MAKRNRNPIVVTHVTVVEVVEDTYAIVVNRGRLAETITFRLSGKGNVGVSPELEAALKNAGLLK